MKVSEFSEKVKGAIARAANKNNISHTQGEEIISHFFRFMRKWISDYRCPRISIMYFGEFRPSLWKINKSIRQRLRSHNNGRNAYDNLVRYIKRYWPIRNRLIQEKNNENTWRTWKKKPDWNEKY